jgi:hypothetical protein
MFCFETWFVATFSIHTSQSFPEFFTSSAPAVDLQAQQIQPSQAFLRSR